MEENPLYRQTERKTKLKTSEESHRRQLGLFRRRSKMEHIFGREQNELQQQITAGAEKCSSPSDADLKFVEADDDHDFLCEGFSSKTAQMSCGHTVTPESLTQWCQRQLDLGEPRLECGVCKAVWPLGEVCKMAFLTTREKKSFEQKLFENVASKELKVKSCPGCRARVIRKDPHSLCVQCPQCTAQKKKTYEFCWQCRKEWKGSAPRSDRCDNEGCRNEALEILRTCPVIEFRDVRGVTGCPSVRACPTCGKLLEHNSKNCKSITCSDCNVKFCFVCLKIFAKCSKTSGISGPCSSGVAPRQTSIPVKKN